MVVCVCVCPCRDSGDCLVLVLSLLHWLSTSVMGWLAMVSKLRRGVRGSRVKSVQRVLASAISIDGEKGVDV